MKMKEGYRDEVDEYFEEQGKKESEKEQTEFEKFLKYMDGKEDPEDYRFILEIDSPLESFFTGMAAISACSIIGMLISMMTPNPIIKWVFIPIITLIIFVYLRMNLNDYYILDAKEKKILFYRKLFGKETKSPIADFSQLYAATSTGNRYSGDKGRHYWKYAALLAVKNGRFIRISEFGDYGKVTKIAKQAGEFLNILYKPGKPETYTRMITENNSGEPQLIFEPWLNHFIKKNLKWYLAGIGLFVIFLLYSMSQAK